MTLLELFPCIRSHPLFVQADTETLNLHFHEKNISVISFSPHSVITPSEEKGRGVGILLSGSAQVSSSFGKSTALLKSLIPGDLFGVATLYTEDIPYPSTIIANSHCQVLWITKEAFHSYMTSSPELLQTYLCFLNKKIVYLNRKIAIFTAGSAENRLAFYLLEAPDHCTSCSMGTLAELLGIGRASLYRAIDSLTENGLIHRTDDRQLSVSDLEALQTFLSTPSDIDSSL